MNEVQVQDWKGDSKGKASFWMGVEQKLPCFSHASENLTNTSMYHR